MGFTMFAHLAERYVIQTKVVRPRELIWVRLDPSNHLAQDDTAAEDVAALVVVFALEALRGHPVGGASRVKFCSSAGIRDLGGEAKVSDDCLHVAVLEAFHEDVLESN